MLYNVDMILENVAKRYADIIVNGTRVRFTYDGAGKFTADVPDDIGEILLSRYGESTIKSNCSCTPALVVRRIYGRK